MDTNLEVKNYLKEYISSGNLTVFEGRNFSIECDSKAFFKDPRDYNRVKNYLRRQKFESDMMGTHTRYLNSNGEVCTALEQNREDNQKLIAKNVAKTAKEVLNEVLIKYGEFTQETVLIAMEAYGQEYHKNKGYEMLGNISQYTKLLF